MLTTTQVYRSSEINSIEKITRVFDFLAYQENVKPISDTLANKVNGDWRKYSTAEFRRQANLVSLGLLRLGLRKGDVVAIISENRPEWNFVDVGVIQIGCVVVPIYPNASQHDYEYVLSHAEAKVVFLSQPEFLKKVKASTLPHLQAIYSFENLPNTDHWTALTRLGEKDAESTLEDYRMAVEPADLMTLMYTSGTTGQPKGVMISHDNLVFNILITLELDMVQKAVVGQTRALSFLPLCHVFEKSVVYSYFAQSISVYYAESLETIGANLQEVKPHAFTTVPRLLEKVFEKIEAKAATLTGVKKKIFQWAMSVAEQYEPGAKHSFFYSMQLSLARRLVFTKWQEALGGNVGFVLSGAAALSPRLAKIFWAAGIPIMEGYGQSESTPSGSVNSFGDGMYKVGTVGRVVPNIEIRIIPEEGYRAGEGEIVMRGRHVMMGYYKNPETTSETVHNGWLHTGDIGIFVDKDGVPVMVAEDQSVTHNDPWFLKITDRKKEIFKTSGGKYIAPLQLETRFKESPFIEQMAVVGENQKFPSALIVPNFEHIKSWCADEDIPYTTNEEMVKHPAVLQKLQEEVDRANEPFGNYERIKKFALLPREWTVETNELTPTMKLKRREIQKNYKEIIDGFYVGE
jgi:long-chain acyl-CoA synthetase